MADRYCVSCDLHHGGILGCPVCRRKQPHPLVALFYVVQFQLDPHLAIDGIVTTLIPRGMIGETVESLAAKIDAALANTEPLTHLNMSDRPLSDEQVRTFLAALRARL